MASELDALYGASGPTASDNQLAGISRLIAEESECYSSIKTAEAIMEEAKGRRRELQHKLIPEAMLAARLRRFTTDDGTEAKLAFITDGALGPARNPEELAEREAKLDVIIEHGGGEIVRQLVQLSFPKEMVDEAEAFRVWCEGEMKKRKWNVTVSRERSVNHQTLGSWIREKMSSTDVKDHLPTAFFERVGIWYGEAAKIIRPKPKG